MLSPDWLLAAAVANVNAVRMVEDTPDFRPDLFEAVRGRRARRHRETGEVWQMDLLHGDHWEVYKTLKEFENGWRIRSVWSDGRLKDAYP